jgi:hypothetical protein
LRGGALRDKQIIVRHASRRKRSRQPTRSFDGRPHSAPDVPGAHGVAAGPTIGTWLYALAAGLPWASGAVISLAAALGLAVAARRHKTQ